MPPKHKPLNKLKSKIEDKYKYLEVQKEDINPFRKQDLALIRKHEKVKDLETGIDYLKDEAGYYHNVMLYRHRHKMSRAGVRLVDWGQTGNKPIIFDMPSLDFAEKMFRDSTQMAKSMKKLLDSIGNIKITVGDLDFDTFMQSPARVFKIGGFYSIEGYPTFHMFYIPKPGGQYFAEKPQRDSKGFYFTGLGTERHYYYIFDTEEVEETHAVEEPQPGPSHARSKRRKQREPQTGLPVSAIGTEHQSLGRKGHGVSRLLAEARDPPVIEFSGKLEQIKGFRKRALKKYIHLISSSTSTYKWGVHPEHKCLFEFNSFSERSKFLKACTLKLPNYRLGSFDTK
ncbi:MAG: E2 protein [Fish-associated papillomavirus 1]|nr:MAG: E2 protein [Fish-associated papillomavirus 1]